jgi:hypothetical protein
MAVFRIEREAPFLLSTVALLLATATEARAGVERYEDAPTTVAVGDAWRLGEARKLSVASCIKFSCPQSSRDSCMYDGGGAGAVHGTKWVFTRSDVANALGLSSATKLRIIAGSVDLATNSPVKVMNELNPNYFTQSALGWHVDYKPSRLAYYQYLSLTDDALNVLNTQGIAAFEAKCGDGFVAGTQQAAVWAQGTSETSTSLRAWHNWTRGQSNGAAPPAGSDVTSTAAALYDSSFGTTSITRSLAGILTEHARQVSLATGNRTYAMNKVIVAPYKVLVGTNFPAAKAPADPVDHSADLDVLADAIGTLQALADASRFLETNPGLFALGTDATHRDANLTWFKKHHARWSTELTRLQTAANGCLANYTNSCGKYVSYWRGRGVGADYDFIPDRYARDCAGPWYLPQRLMVNAPRLAVTSDDRRIGTAATSGVFLKGIVKFLQPAETPNAIQARVTLKGAETSAAKGAGALEGAVLFLQGLGDVFFPTGGVDLAGETTKTVYTPGQDGLDGFCSLRQRPSALDLTPIGAGHGTLEGWVHGAVTGQAKFGPGVKAYKQAGPLVSVTCHVSDGINSIQEADCSEVVISQVRVNLVARGDTTADQFNAASETVKDPWDPAKTYPSSAASSSTGTSIGVSTTLSRSALATVGKKVTAVQVKGTVKRLP